MKRFKLTDEQLFYLIENNLQVNLQKAQRMPCFVECPPERCNCGIYDDPEVLTDVEILERSIDALTAHFDEFIGECMAGAPSAKALARARGYLPAKCANAFKKAGGNTNPETPQFPAQGIDHAKRAGGEREAFEAWHGGIYRGYQADIAWAAWQARGQQAGGAEGCAIVPKEPTEAICQAGRDAGKSCAWSYAACYRAMIAAAAAPGEAG